MNDLATEFRALADCLRMVAGGIERLAERIAANPAPFPLPPAAECSPLAENSLRRWTPERIGLLRDRVLAAPSGARLDWRGIVGALNALAGPAVSDDQARTWWAKVGRPRFAPKPAPAEPMRGQAARPQVRRQVGLPDAADEARRLAAAALTAPADAATIRSWARANGVEVLASGATSGAELARVNDARRRLGLTPFAVVLKPLGALAPAELTRMRRADEIGVAQGGTRGA